MTPTVSPPTMNAARLEWVQQWAAVLGPERVEWCDGSEEVEDRTFIRSEKLPAALNIQFDALAARLAASR